MRDVSQMLSRELQPAMQLIADALREAEDFFSALQLRLKESLGPVEVAGCDMTQAKGCELHLYYMDMKNCANDLRDALSKFERNMCIQYEYA